MRLYGPLWMALRRYRPPRETALRLVSEVTVLTLHFPERRDEQVQTRLHLLPLLLVTARLKTVALHPRLRPSSNPEDLTIGVSLLMTAVPRLLRLPLSLWTVASKLKRTIVYRRLQRILL